MKVLNLLISGGIGGIECLCNNIDQYSKIDNYWCFLFNGGIIADKIKTRNSNKTFILNLNSKKILKSVFQINKICKENEIEIITIHNEGIYCNLIYLILKMLNPKIKFVRFLHSCFDAFSLKNKLVLDKLYIKCFKKALKKSDLIISVSEAVQKTHENKFDIKYKNKKVIYNGIDDSFFKNKNKRKECDCCRLIFVGRLVKQKGVDLLLLAVNKILNMGFDIELVIVGDGIERKKLEKLSVDLNIEKKVSFIGFKDNIISWLDNADIFIYPSRWEEAFGISVVEAMARGCFPIVSNKGGLPEVVNFNEECLFDNEEQLIEKIVNIIKDKKMLVNKEKFVNEAKKFSIHETISNIEKEYEELLRSKNEF